ncbi:MAG: DUF1670 domain-containing protein [Anaerolineae bacterium]|nr:MAG: DUF1670 domain-containing protein [Anaerolineae bacterium]
MILQRLEKLSPAARQVIQIAAVLGEIFRFAVLRRVSPLDQSTTLRALADLTRHRLLERAEADYRFSHAVVRTVAYSSMDAESRRILHRKVVEALESMPACPAEVLAHHCDQGGLSEKAASYFAQAGREAMALYALPQALEYFSRAVELDDGFSPEERFALYVDYESALDMVGAQKQHAEILERMNRLAKASANANWRLKVYLCKARYYTEVGDLDKAEAEAQQALAAARAAADPGSEARALMLYGRIANLRARAADGLEPLGKAVALFREIGDRAGEAEAINELANAQLGIKAYAEARENCEAALSLCEALDDRPGQANALGLLGIIVMEQGDIEAAEAYYRRELEIARSIGYRYSEARSLANMGNLDLCRARISQAYSRYRQALDAFAACENRRGVALLSANLGNLMINSFGDLDQGEEFLQQALSYYRQVDDRIGVGHCLSLLGQLAYFRGQMDAARSYLEDGIDCLVNAGEVWIAVQGYTMLVPVLLETGDEKTALECIEKAETLCREHGMDDMLTGVLSCKGYVWLRLGDCARAYHLSSQAMQRIGDDVLDAQIHYYYHYHIARACGRWGEAREALQKAVRLVESILEGLDPEQREIAKANVWDFREILSAWESMQPRRQKVRLPRADAPRGRPLRDDEYVEITWTLWTPEDASITQKTERRRARLLRLVQEAAAQGAAPTQQHLAEALGVGVRTIARDMAALRAEGNAIPVRH